MLYGTIKKHPLNKGVFCCFFLLGKNTIPIYYSNHLQMKQALYQSAHEIY